MGTDHTSMKSLAARIDIASNRLLATVHLIDGSRGAHPRTPVLVDGDVWISTYVSNISRRPVVLVKVDLETNTATDQLIFTSESSRAWSREWVEHDGFLWGLHNEHVIRLEFLPHTGASEVLL